MTPEAQRIAIAEACGYRKKFDQNSGHEIWITPDNKIAGWVYSTNFIPDYLSDLNAMHEAEKVLTDEEHGKFRFILLRLTETSGRPDERAYISATPAQRAEAFCKVKFPERWKP